MNSRASKLIHVTKLIIVFPSYVSKLIAMFSRDWEAHSNEFPYQTNFLFLDKSCESISSILFYGNELSLVIFEILCFLTFDLAFSGSFVGSYFISAAITFIIYRTLSLIRRSLGQRNLSQKTLIDDRFLI